METEHAKRILLVEDLEQFHGPITRWLQEEGYCVATATSYAEAFSRLESDHFHVAIVDVRLEEEDENDEEGMKLLEDMETMQLRGVMPSIILTARATKENILAAWHERGVFRFVEKKPGYRSQLMEAVRQAFDEELGINFALAYDVDSGQHLPQVLNDIKWPPEAQPPPSVLLPQVWDLFGKLFSDARSVYLAPLRPGLTGAAVLRAQPTWNHGLGPSYVAKVNRRDKIAIEEMNYQSHVARYMSSNRVTQANVARTRHLGALLFSFAETVEAPLQEFDDFYEANSPECIAVALDDLFRKTCRYWYDRRERCYADLVGLYYQSLNLTQATLVERIQEVLPEFDPQSSTIRLDQLLQNLVNPIAWLARHGTQAIRPVYHAITHGDLTGRNILVDEAGQCWLIDFYRTYPSHILRDFLILETDIKYRLMPDPGIEAFHKLETALLARDQLTDVLPVDLDWPPQVQKAASVLHTLQSIAHDFALGTNSNARVCREEYLIGLLIATLNVVRLRHIEPERKLQALLSASLICAELG
jgi:CheY-like chemotaxis protein